MIGLLNQLLFIEAKIIAAYKFINLILKEYKYCKKVMNKHFNNNLIMSEKEEHLFQQSNGFWICKNRIDNNLKKILMKKKLEIIFT